MTIKPLRTVDEHDVVPFFALDQTGLKGMPVSIKAGTSGYYSTQQLGIFSNLSPFPNVAYSPRWEVKSKVTPTVTGSKPFGITLYDTRSTTEWGEQYIYEPEKAKERQIVVSGEGVPIARKGTFLIGPWGTGDNPLPGNFIAVKGTGDYGYVQYETGVVGSVTGARLPVFGMFLGVKDNDGYAVVDINCY